jgi:aryl-alcohol dehydrogenase-like predicted oxidoreductase
MTAYIVLRSGQVRTVTSEEEQAMSEIPQTQLGTTGIPVSRFILGAGNFGGVAMVTGPGIGLDEEQSGALIDHALGLGITVVDSADIYCQGESERIVGAWHERHPDSNLVITTKTGFTKDGPNLKPERLRSQIERSRKILGRIDLFLAHTVDPDTPWSDSLPVLSDAVDQGLIRAYGLSNVTERNLSSALETADRLGIRRPQLIQNRYSLIARGDDEGVLPLVRAEAISYTPYSPLAAGLLAGRYLNGEGAEQGIRLSTQVPTKDAMEDQALVEKIRRFNDAAKQNGLAPAALALAWLLSRPGVTAPIVGVSKPHHWDPITASVRVAWTHRLEETAEEAFAG